MARVPKDRNSAVHARNVAYRTAATAKGIKCPVRACALVYDETAEVELLGCYCISDPEFTSAGEKTR